MTYISALPKQAEDCKSESSDIYPLSSEWVASSEQGQRNKATYTAIRWGAFGCPFTRDNHKQPTSSPAGYECYSFYCFYCSYYPFFQSILKDFFLASNTQIQSEGGVTVGNLKRFSTVCAGETSPTQYRRKANTQIAEQHHKRDKQHF